MLKQIRRITAASIFSFLLLNTPYTEIPKTNEIFVKENPDKVIVSLVTDTILFEDRFCSDLFPTVKEHTEYINLNIVSYEEPKIEVVPMKTRAMEPEIDISQDEINLIALLTDAEAGGESEYGQRLVIDTVLNRLTMDGFPKTVYDVINQPNQYSPVSSGRIWNRTLREDLVKLVEEECMNRTNKDVLFFRTKYYHTFGTPMFQVGAHYFSTL